MEKILTPEGLPVISIENLLQYSKFIKSQNTKFDFVFEDLERNNPNLLNFFLANKKMHGNEVFNRLLGFYSVLNYQSYNIGMKGMPFVEDYIVEEVIKKYDNDPTYPICPIFSLSKHNPHLTDLLVDEIKINCNKKERNASLSSIGLLYIMLGKSINNHYSDNKEI